MELRLFQWLVPIIVTIFILNQWLRYRRGRLHLGEVLFTIVLWAGVGAVALFPDAISGFIAQLFGFKSNTNAILFLGLMLMFYFQYRLYRIQVQQRRDLTQLNREIALRDFEIENS